MKTYNVSPQDIRRALDAFESLYPWRLIGSVSGNAFGDVVMKDNDDTWYFNVRESKLYKLCWDSIHDRHWELVWTEEDEEDEAERAAERESVGENWW